MDCVTLLARDFHSKVREGPTRDLHEFVEMPIGSVGSTTTNGGDSLRIGNGGGTSQAARGAGNERTIYIHRKESIPSGRLSGVHIFWRSGSPSCLSANQA